MSATLGAPEASTSATLGAPGAQTAPLRVRCRAIGSADAPAIVALLARGFPDRTRAYWEQAMARLLAHAATLATPRCGQVLDCEGYGVVGVLLLIPAADRADGTPPRCNLSSWYVDPRFNAYAALLALQAFRRRDVTHFNISPAPHTWATIEAQGFSRYSRGRLVVPAALLRPRRSIRIALAGEPGAGGGGLEGLPPGEAALLERHAGYGCLALVATTPAGPEPFLFLPWKIKGRVPSAQLVYCRDIAAFAGLAGPLGRFLLRHGLPLVTVDLCAGPAPGLPGLPIADRSPKYARGPAPPRTGDLVDTELVMFGP